MTKVCEQAHSKLSRIICKHVHLFDQYSLRRLQSTCVGISVFTFILGSIFRQTNLSAASASGDVSRYIAISKALLAGNLDKSNFTHGSFFASLGIPTHLFLPDTNPYPVISVMIGISATSFLLKEIIKSLSVRPSSTFLAYITVFFTSPSARYFYEGANNTISASLIFILIAFLLKKKIKRQALFFLRY